MRRLKRSGGEIESSWLFLGFAFVLLSLWGCSESRETGDIAELPNFVIIFCDDLGYADIGPFGSQVNRTPHIDRMAAEGMKFTDFYSTSGVCTPSRSSLMTGCYPRRVGLDVSAAQEWVLFPYDKAGIHENEITIAELLRERGYVTACIGKWHLGDQPPFFPTRHGFDSYYGIPYSNDMGADRSDINPPLPLMQDTEIIEAPVDQSTITRRYTEKAVQFITSHKDRAFFLYLPHTMPHFPLHAGAAFEGRSEHGKYSDVVEELDWSTGEILRCVSELGLDAQTLVIFTSDNGGTSRGSNAPLKGGKGSTWEGGMRIPCVMRWPGTIPAGSTCRELATTMDFLPTFTLLAGGSPPSDRTIDGQDIRPLLRGEQGAVSSYQAFYYYYMEQLQAVRSGRWKLHIPKDDKRKGWHGEPYVFAGELYDLEDDPGENNNVIDQYPEIAGRLVQWAEKARLDIGDGDILGLNQRSSGMVDDPVPLKGKRMRD
jgi:arylsulfatase A-like enzyme